MEIFVWATDDANALRLVEAKDKGLKSATTVSAEALVACSPGGGPF